MQQYHVGGQVREQVWAQVSELGSDLMVYIGGGEEPHLGAVALGSPEPARPGYAESTATVSVISVYGHRDDEVARYAAKMLSAALGCQVAVVAGIHIDNASPEELAILMANVKSLCAAILADLSRIRRCGQ